MYIKFPLALYRNGELLTVHSDEEEAAAQADGYTDWNTDNDALVDAAAHAKTGGATRDDMKAEAKARGIEFAHNISNAKLAELLAEAQ